MSIASIHVHPLEIPFRHAAAERAVTQAIWVKATATDGNIGNGEGCPREYVTGESVATAQAFVAAHVAEWVAVVRGVTDLREWVARNAHEIDINPAAWTAVELALLDLLGKRAGLPVEALLGLPALGGRFRYTAVLGDAAPRAFEGQLARYRDAGFHDFKIKLAGERARDRQKVRALQAAGVDPQRVRADANNLWRDAATAIADLRALDFPFSALEEPLRAGDHGGMARVAAALDTRIILDESLARQDQLDVLPATGRWVVNLRVSKMGGVLRSLAFLREARRRGLPVIVGAHVGETSMLARAALTVASAASDCLLAQEGAFGTHLLERDVAEPPLMFGAGGLIEPDAALAAAHGWGLKIHEPA